MALISFDHVQLAMPEGQEAQARGFYVGVLGLSEDEKPPELAARGGCWFRQGDLKLHLGVEADFRPARKAHPGILVDDIADLKRRAQAAGLVVRHDAPIPDYDRVFMDDPFGNRLEFLQKI